MTGIVVCKSKIFFGDCPLLSIQTIKKNICLIGVLHEIGDVLNGGHVLILIILKAHAVSDKVHIFKQLVEHIFWNILRREGSLSIGILHKEGRGKAILILLTYLFFNSIYRYAFTRLLVDASDISRYRWCGFGCHGQNRISAKRIKKCAFTCRNRSNYSDVAMHIVLTRQGRDDTARNIIFIYPLGQRRSF